MNLAAVSAVMAVGLKVVPRAVRVHRNVARLLSTATYRQLVLALREMISNAADANAPRVDIEVKLEGGANGVSTEGGSIIVTDFGDGMDSRQFEEKFLTVGATTKIGDYAKINSKGRRIIGRFGVGFLSILPFAEQVSFETRHRGAGIVHGAKVLGSKFLSTQDNKSPEDVSRVDIEGWDRAPSPDEQESFTRITLTNLTRLAHETLDASLLKYGFRFYRDRDDPITNEEKIKFLKFWIARVAPLGYVREGRNSEVEVDEDLLPHVPLDTPITEELKECLPRGYAPIQVIFNGKQLKRVYDSKPRLKRAVNLQGANGSWKAEGVLWSPREIIHPPALRGIAVRVADVSIGFPGYLEINEKGRVYGKLQHITGEVHVEGLEADIEITRDRFSPSAAAEDFRDQMHGLIIQFERDLQKPAKVMEEVRRFKKGMMHANPDERPSSGIAPVVAARTELQRLMTQAKQVDINVEVSPTSEFKVPRGEREIKVGRAFIDRLGVLRAGDREYRIEVQNHKADVTTSELLEGALRSPEGVLFIAGPHVLLSGNEWGLANTKVLASLAQCVRGKVITKTQAAQFLEHLAEFYGG